MSRNIPTDRPLSDEDRAWLQMWSQEEKIANIDLNFPPGSAPDPAKDVPAAPAPANEDDDGVDVDADISKFAESLTVAELKAALKKSGIDFDSDDLKDDLVAKLAIGLQDKRNAGEAVDLTSE